MLIRAMLQQQSANPSNQVIIRDGIPGPPITFPGGIDVHTGVGESPIPPQVVDLAYGFFIMVAVILIGWPLSRAFGRRLERGARTGALSPAVGEQLQRIEQAVDAMAIEVERISEAQRYLAKVQSGQLAEPGALRSVDRR